jgi:hypothetical protein
MRGGPLLGAAATAIVGLMASLACAPASRAQANLEPSINDYLPSGDPEPSREDWRQRVEDAKRRAQEASRQRRENPDLHRPIPEDPEVVATERVLNDDSLQHGDIIATKKGMFVYKGRMDQPRKVEDFERVDAKPAR